MSYKCFYCGGLISEMEVGPSKHKREMVFHKKCIAKYCEDCEKQIQQARGIIAKHSFIKEIKGF